MSAKTRTNRIAKPHANGAAQVGAPEAPVDDFDDEESNYAIIRPLRYRLLEWLERQPDLKIFFIDVFENKEATVEFDIVAEQPKLPRRGLHPRIQIRIERSNAG